MAENATILVADREKSICQLLRGVLQGAGYEVLVTQDAENSLELLEKRGVDVALIDDGLPEMGGIEVSKRILESKPDVIVAIMGACGTKRSALDEMAVGVYRHMLKPFEDPLLIRRIVEESLEERKARLQEKLALDGENAGQEVDDDEDDGRPVRVILADSSDEERREIREALSRHSCEIREATCAQEALLILSKGEHDVLVVGYDMGDMTADDVMLRAKRLDDMVAVVVTATSPTLKMTTSLIKRGAAGFIEKPLKDPTRTATAILRQGLNARDRREALAESSVGVVHDDRDNDDE